MVFIIMRVSADESIRIFFSQSTMKKNFVFAWNYMQVKSNMPRINLKKN